MIWNNSRREDVLVANEVTAEEVFKKTENMLKKVCPNLSGDCIDRAHRIGPELQVARKVSQYYGSLC